MGLTACSTNYAPIKPYPKEWYEVEETKIDDKKDVYTEGEVLNLLGKLKLEIELLRNKLKTLNPYVKNEQKKKN